jgi:hypothetical protein
MNNDTVTVGTLIERHNNKIKKYNFQDLKKTIICDCDKIVDKIVNSDEFPVFFCIPDNTRYVICDYDYRNLYYKELRSIMSERINGSDKRMYIDVFSSSIEVGFKSDRYTCTVS